MKPCHFFLWLLPFYCVSHEMDTLNLPSTNYVPSSTHTQWLGSAFLYRESFEKLAITSVVNIIAKEDKAWKLWTKTMSWFFVIVYAKFLKRWTERIFGHNESSSNNIAHIETSWLNYHLSYIWRLYFIRCISIDASQHWQKNAPYIHLIPLRVAYTVVVFVDLQSGSWDYPTLASCVCQQLAPSTGPNNHCAFSS